MIGQLNPSWAESLELHTCSHTLTQVRRITSSNWIIFCLVPMIDMCVTNVTHLHFDKCANCVQVCW